MSFTFSPRRGTSVTEIGMIRFARASILAAHAPRGQFVVMTGATGTGKTTAAVHLARQISSTFRADPNDVSRFDARYYQATDHRHTRQGSTELMLRRVIAEFGLGVLGLPAPRDVRQIDLPMYLQTLAAGLRHQEVQMVFVDEAGYLPPAALECLASLLDLMANQHEHPLTIVLVGMENLANSVRQHAHVLRRAQTWIPFRPCSQEEVMQVLAPIDPFFARLDIQSDAAKEALEFLMKEEVSQGGVIGLVVTLAESAVAYARATGKEMGLRMLEVAHALKTTSQATVKAS
jgi:DNA transposition AAA+ family ATPase